MTLSEYIAIHNPEELDLVLQREFGFPPSDSVEQLAAHFDEAFEREGDDALLKLIQAHPDKPLILKAEDDGETDKTPDKSGFLKNIEKNWRELPDWAQIGILGFITYASFKTIFK